MATIYVKKKGEPSKKKDHIPHSHKVRRKYRVFLLVLAAILTISLYLNITTYVK